MIAIYVVACVACFCLGALAMGIVCFASSADEVELLARIERLQLHLRLIVKEASTRAPNATVKRIAKIAKSAL